jgi:hypothetical protein
MERQTDIARRLFVFATEILEDHCEIAAAGHALAAIAGSIEALSDVPG